MFTCASPRHLDDGYQAQQIHKHNKTKPDVSGEIIKLNQSVNSIKTFLQLN